MSMVTQCPHCNTAFNVTPDQLFARDGRVRCGQCQQVFDGLVNLTSLEALQAGVPPPLAEATEAAAQQAAVQSLEDPLPAAPRSFSPENWPMLPDVPAVPVPPLPLEVVADAQAASAQGRDGVVTGEGSAGSLAAIGAQAAPSPESPRRPLEEIRIEAIEASETPPARRISKMWALAATLAALALGLQMIHTFRSEIAAHFPAVKPVLVQACDWTQSVQWLSALPGVRCTVPPLQRPAALNILASDLLIVDKAKPHLVQLIVTLQNQSSLEVGYPALDLVLNDKFEHVVARRVFLPHEYLRGDDALKRAIAASVTTTVRVNLDVSELQAGGFALLLIPAPQT